MGHTRTFQHIDPIVFDLDILASGVYDSVASSVASSAGSWPLPFYRLLLQFTFVPFVSNSTRPLRRGHLAPRVQREGV